MRKYDINTLIKENKPTEEEKEKVEKLCVNWKNISKNKRERIRKSIS